jgi:hypothetical protein
MNNRPVTLDISRQALSAIGHRATLQQHLAAGDVGNVILGEHPRP